MRKVTLITSIGAGLEYYDFVIYALLASYISINFFPKAEPSLALIQTFSIFAVGYFARPVGGLLFGLMGDRFGRKNAFLFSILLMSIATLGMGLLPTFASWGWFASVCLLVFRILQGMAFGAELPGAITFLSEHANRSKRGLHTSFMTGSLGLGSALGSGLIILLIHWLTPTQMQAWGWRIPFLLGSLLALVGYLLRRKTQETPLFVNYITQAKQPQQAKVILTHLFKAHWLRLLQGIGIMLFTGCLIVFGLALPAFLHAYFGYELAAVYQANAIGVFYCALLLPLFGLLSDTIGRKLQLASVSLIFVFTSCLLFKLLTFHHQIALLGFVLLYQTVIAATAACYIPLSAELFPTPVRYTGIAICYNIGGCISGLTPLVVNAIMHASPQIHWVCLLFSLLALLTFSAALSLKYQHQQLLN